MTFARSKIFSLVLILLIVGACEEYDQKQVTIAGGKLDQVMMLMDDTHVETEFSDHIAREFSAPIPVLPQGEPQFLINIREFSRYQNASSVFHKYRNLAFCALVKGNSTITKFVRQQLGDEKIKEMIDNGELFMIRKNEFARHQQVVYMVAADEESFYQLFEQQKEDLFGTIRDFANQRLDKQTYMEGRNQMAEKAIASAFEMKMKVPRDFRVFKDSGNVVWLNKETIFRNRQEVQVKKIREDIFITSFTGHKKKALLNSTDPLVEEEVDESYPYTIMDTIATDYLFGRSEQYPIYIDKSQPLFQQSRTINGIEVLDSRGLWRCDMPLMGGFFYTITFPHPRTEELLVVYGFVYAAGSDKRPIHRKFDVIFNSISIPEG